MEPSKENVIKIANLLKQNTSLHIVSDFLKDKGLTHSVGSWEDVVEKRFWPIINSGDGVLVIEDIVGLLNTTEEHGKQHIFLYSCSVSRANQITNRATVESVAGEIGLNSALTDAYSLDTPDSPTVTDIRYESGSLIIKIIELRFHMEPLDETLEDNILTKKWQRVYERAVNVVRMSPTGLLEIRIASQSSGTQYEHQLDKIWEIIEPFIARKYFSEISLSNAKNKLIEKRAELSDTVRYSTTLLRNDEGNSIRAAAGSINHDLADDEGVKEGLDAFMGHQGYCDGTNIFFLKSDGLNTPNNDIHVLLSGMMNEFALPANCISGDYNYVLRKIQELNA